MKKSEEYQIRNPLDALYAAEMAAALPKAPVRPKSTIQAASTQRVLDMTESELFVYRNREIDFSKAQVLDKDGNIDVAPRMFSAQEVMTYERMRQGTKNTLGDFMGTGFGSVTPEKKERAIEAFTYSPPAELTKNELAKVKTLKELETVDQKIEKKRTLIDKAKNSISNMFSRNKTSVKKNSIGHVLYKASGGKDEDLDIHD